MKVAYVFSTSGHTASYKLGQMILPQLEQSAHGVEVVGMMFFDDNTFLLRKGDPMGQRLAKVAKENEGWLKAASGRRKPPPEILLRGSRPVVFLICMRH